MRPDTAEALRGLLLLAALGTPVVLALKRPSERVGTTVHRYRVLIGLYLGIGFMTQYGGPIVLAWSAIALLALLGIGYIAEAIHKHHLAHEARHSVGSK